jgi:hypothetical protein
VLRLHAGLRGTLARVESGYDRAAREYPVLAGRFGPPKAALLSLPMAYLGITGIYSPFTGEAHVNATVPEPELPFTASHEIAHARGFAREDEANYLAYLACSRHPDRDFAYSGAFVASNYALAALREADPQAYARVAAERSASVRRDLEALAAWARRYKGPAATASHVVNDAYLRSQGVGGVRSYGRMVDLLLAERRLRLSRDRPIAAAGR